ncbi:MAG: hypothetical protein E7430_00285 [Ruminococcaceae bacterium]|nr:hypothetical protein [Oscillospiraceae bacterium]
MKKLQRFVIIICILALLLTFAGAETSKENSYVLLQPGNALAIVNGATKKAVNSAGTETATYYSMNGTAMVPLYFIADCFDLELTWNGLTKQTQIKSGNFTIGITSGSSEITVGRKKSELSAPVTVTDGSTYVPIDIISKIPGLYHVSISSQPEGRFILITNNIDDISDPETLDSFLKTGFWRLGPSKMNISDSALGFRANSMYSFAAGEQYEILSDNKKAVPYCTSDGYLMIPLEYALRSSGINCRNYTKYSDSCDFSIGSKNYSLYYGEHFILSGGYDYSNKYYCELRAGAVYVSASTFEKVSGLNAIFTTAPTGVVFSGFSGYSSMADAVKDIITSLPDKRSDASAYVALTFDDGPSGALTERLLDGLLERGAHATFFLCDYRISAFSSVMDRYIPEGHEVANHSATHASLTSLKGDSLAVEIDSTNASIFEKSGAKPTLLRPPGGSYNKRVLDALSDRGMSCIIWSVDPMDWKYLNTDKVVNSIISNVSDGDIVLLHDLYSTSVDAALEVIDILTERGFAFVTVSELAEIKGYDLASGEVYHSFK